MSMLLKESPARVCVSCHDYKFCSVFWGTDCKRNGGNKIPRMKSIKLKNSPIVEKEKITRQDTKFENKKKRINLIEPIRTKSTMW